METTAAGWTLIDRAAGVLAHTYSFRGGATSTTFVARMADGRLMVVSPSVGLNDAIAAELATFGEVGALVANNGFHHLGQVEWRQRYPQARCFAPAQAIARIKKKNPAVGAFEPLSALAPLLGPEVGFREVANTKAGESWFWAKTASGSAWFLSDVLINLPKLPPAFPLRLLFKWTGSAPGFRVFHLALKFVVKDKRAALRQLREDMAAHPPTVIVPAHGPLLDHPGITEETRALLDAAL